MIGRDELITTINEIIGEELLVKANQLDHRANDVQLMGNEKVSKVALGVSTTMDFLQEVVESDAQFTIAHHGLDLGNTSIVNSRLHPGIQSQLAYALENNLTVAGYHFSLDSHPEIGNNSTIIRELGAKRIDLPYMDEWGWVGEFEDEQDVKDLADKCADIFAHDVFAVYAGPKKIKRIGVCSGGAKPSGKYLWEIMGKKIDLHITGEIGEPGPEIAKGIGFNYFSCGHYATEVFGVQELGKKLKDHYKDKLDVEFIDIPNLL